MFLHRDFFTGLCDFAAVLADLVAGIALLGAGRFLRILQFGFTVRILIDGKGDFLNIGIFLAAEGDLRGVNGLARRDAGRRRRLAGDRRIDDLRIIAALGAGERSRSRGAVLCPRPSRRLAKGVLADNSRAVSALPSSSTK